MNSFWSTFRLSELCENITDGKHGDCKDEPESGFFFLSAKDVVAGRLLYEGARQITEADFLETHRRTKLEPLDILITNSGTIGRMALAPFREKTIRTTFQKSVAIIKPQKRLVDPRFLYFLLMGRIDSLTDFAGGTAQKNLLLRDIRNFLVTIPNIVTQRRIAAVLSAYDDLIENNQRRIAILEQIARNLYREWFVYFRFPGHEDVEIVERDGVRVPEGWGVTPLQDFGEIITGKTPSKQVPEYFGHDMPFIKIPDMHGNMFCLDAEEGLSELGVISQRNKTIPQNSLCVSCIGTAGLVAITTKKSQTNQQINSIVLNNFYLREFLYFALLDLKETIMRYSANGATMVNLNKGKFEALQIIRPQDAIFLTRYGYHTNRCQGGADGRHLDYSCFCRD